MKKITLLMDISDIGKRMRTWRTFCCALILLSCVQMVNAQVGSTYAFTQSAGTYTAISGGTVLGTASNDDETFSNSDAGYNIGFNFVFNGATYDKFGVNANGWIKLGAGSVNSTSTGISGGNLRAIAGMSMDLAGKTGAELSYTTTGTAPNRKLVVQWKGYSKYSSGGNASEINFQIVLNETTNVVNVIYGTVSTPTGITGTPEVGIRSGSTMADINNRTGADWAATTAGTDTFSGVTFNPTTVPASGLTFAWTGVACSGTVTAGTLGTDLTRYACAGATPATITTTGASAFFTGITYQWEQSTDNGANWANAVGGTGTLNSATYSPPAFAGSSIQYRVRVTCANGASTAVSDVVTINSQIAPVTQASALVLGNSAPTTFDISWTAGSGGRRLVYVSTSPITDPVSGTGLAAFTASGVYTSGQQIVYDGTGTSVTITGLTCGTPYFVKVFEYSRCGSGPYDVNFNTTTGTNALTVTSPVTTTMPLSTTFVGFTGGNLGAVFPGWYEASITTADGDVPTSANPTGLSSAWEASTSLTVKTAKVNLYTNVTNAWIISPKFNVTANSRIKFKAALTSYNGSSASTGMVGTDDKVKLMISTDCGATWTALVTYDASNAAMFTNNLQDYIVAIPATYNTQTVQIGFQATDGPLNEGPDYDFHLGGITVELIPDCDKPVLAATTNVAKNGATINWTVPAAGVPTGYQYVVSTANTTPAGPGTPVSGLTADVTPLLPSTTYYVFVRTVCGADFSDWTASGTFTTLCDYNDITGVTPNTRCGAGDVTISAAATGGNIKWYAAATGGAPLSVGTSYSPTVTATTTFYASAEEGAGTGIIGTGTGLTNDTEVLTAFNNRFSSYKMQIVYTAAELTAAGLTAGSITSLGFNTTTLGDGNSNTAFTIKLAATTASDFGTVADFVTTGFTTVYGPSTYTHTASGWQVINFASPYTWDGTSNIIVEVSHNGANATNNAKTYYTPTTGNTILYNFDSTATSGTLGVNRLNIMFGTCSSPRVPVVATIDAAPAFTLSANPAAVCVGQTTAAVTVTAGAADYDTYVWTPATGVTGDETAGWVFSPTVSTVYTLQASQSAGSLCNAEPVAVNVTIGQMPVAMTIAPSGSPLAVCEGQSQLLTATGGVNPGVVTLGNGTTAPGSTGYPNPFSAYYGGAKTQMLFKAAELEAQGLANGGVIKTLEFDFFASNDAALNEMEIRIGSTTVENLTAGIVPSTSLTTSYAGTYTPVDGVTGYVTFTLATPYAYTGGNLIVEIVHNQGNGGNGSGTRTKTTTTAFDSVFTQAKDNVAGGVSGFDAEASYSISSASTSRPNIKFNYEILNSVVWTPQAGLYTDAAATVAYTGQARRTVYVKPTGAATYTATSTTTAGCSVTATVDVTVSITPAPTVPAATQEFCNAGTVANLVATGTGIKWYAAATGGVALTPTTALVNNIEYFASQTVGGCESVLRTGRTAIINVVNAPTVADATPEFCNAATVADLLPNGADIKWYAGTAGGTALASTVALVSGTPYYASQTVNGCESLLRSTVTPTINVVGVPTIADDTQDFCIAATVADLEPSGADIKWYADPTGGTALASTVALVSGTPYYASLTVDGCEGLVRGEVTATVTVAAKPTGDDNQEFCTSATIADLDATGTGIIWYDAETAGNVLAATASLTDGGMYYASQTVNGCESAERLEVMATIYNVIADAPENVSVCDDYELPALVNGAYYTEANGQGTELAAGTEIEQTTTIYVYNAEGIDITCSAEHSFTVTVANVPAPTGDETQTISTPVGVDVTIADLVADVVTGGTVTWYASEDDAEDGENPLPASTVLEQNTTYYATQTVGTCTSEDVFAVLVDIVLGRDGFDVKAFTYHPNPVQNVLNIAYSSEITSVTVFNLLGQKVISQQANANDVKVDLSSLADGAYVVNVTAGGTVKTIKVIKKQ